jgi:hypothetical protein
MVAEVECQPIELDDRGQCFASRLDKLHEASYSLPSVSKTNAIWLHVAEGDDSASVLELRRRSDSVSSGGFILHIKNLYLHVINKRQKDHTRLLKRGCCVRQVTEMS